MKKLNKVNNHILFGIICLLTILVVIQAIFLIRGVLDDARNRKQFINEVYFLLKDIDEGMENADYVAEQFVILDVICDKQRTFTNGAFSYGPPGEFQKLGEQIQAGDYTDSDWLSLRENVQDVIKNLSAESGNSENEKLTYRQVSDILKGLLN